MISMLPRNSALDCLRGLAVLYVMIFHTFLEVWPFWNGSMPQGAMRILFMPFAFGRYAVSFFIVLSGHCLAKRYATDFKIRTFYKNRFFKTILPYYSALLACTIVSTTLLKNPSGSNFDMSIPVTMHGVILHLLAIHNYFSEAIIFNINHSHWSLGPQIQLYVLFPLIFFFLKKNSLLTVFIVGVIGIVLTETMTPLKDRILFVSLGLAQAQSTSFLHAASGSYRCFQFLTLFTTGMALSDATIVRVLTTFKLPLIIVGSTAIVVTTALTHHYSLLFSPELDYAALLVSAGLIVWWGSKPSSATSSKCSILGKIGRESFSIYLLHIPILGIVHYSIKKSAVSSDALTLGLLLTVGLGAVVCISSLFHRYVEKPLGALSRS